MKGKVIFNSVIFPDDYLEMITGEPYVVESDYEICQLLGTEVPSLSQ